MKKLFPLFAALYLPMAGAAYKCVDDKGVTHIGDTEPAACANVMMYEVSRSGAVIRSIEPTPTPEQLRVKLEEAERRKEAERAAGEQKRKDLALLSSYSKEREFDVARDRNIEPITGRINNSKERIKVIEKRVKDLEDEMEFYKAGKSKASKARGARFAGERAAALARREGNPREVQRGKRARDRGDESQVRQRQAALARLESQPGGAQRGRA